jgi:glycosyltransferase involved in cell wall biosynthesis
LKLVVVSHPCVTPANQEFWARVHRHVGGRVTIVAPASWRNEYGTQALRRWPAFEGDLQPLPVFLAGNIPLHAYRARVGQLLRRQSPDVVFVHHEPYGPATFQFVAAARRLGLPVGIYTSQNIVKRYPPPFSWMERAVHRRASFATAISGAVADSLRAKGYRGPIALMPPGIDVSSFPQLAARRGEGRRFTVGYVGRLAEEKGVDTLVDALRRPATAGMRALIAGDGSAADDLRARAATSDLNGRVSWVGYVSHDRVADVYGQLDLVVVPSRTTAAWTEQFGRVVAEALACGVPVLTSDSGELPKLVADTGGGWTFPEGDADALAARLAALAADPGALRARADRGRARVRELYDIDVVAQRLAEVVRAAAGRSR